MKWKATLKPRRYEIKHDLSVGFYLYVFKDDECVFDYLQDTLELAIECAWDDFGVPKEAWEKVKE